MLKVFSSKISRRIVIISAWCFFILLNAFYSGALTMFFSSAPSVPFSTSEEGLRRHPVWDLVMMTGTEAAMVERAKAGEELFAKWLRRNRTEALVTSFEGVLRSTHTT